MRSSLQAQRDRALSTLAQFLGSSLSASVIEDFYVFELVGTLRDVSLSGGCSPISPYGIVRRPSKTSARREGTYHVPNALAGTTFQIRRFSGKPIVIEKWDGQPFELQ